MFTIHNEKKSHKSSPQEFLSVKKFIIFFVSLEDNAEGAKVRNSSASRDGIRSPPRVSIELINY